MVPKTESECNAAPEMPSFTITLVRHGETDENAASTIQGQMNTKLNANGLSQARALATTFPIGDFDLIYSSDLARAYETCATLINHSPDHSHGLTESAIRTDRRLRARNFGSLEGKPVDRLLFEALGQGAGKTVTDFTPEGGESSLEVQQRVLNFVESRLVPEVDEASSASTTAPLNILLVTHAVVISELLAHFESFGHHSFLKRAEAMRTPNTAVSQFLVHYQTSGPSRSGRITSAECFQSHGTGHLEPVSHKTRA